MSLPPTTRSQDLQRRLQQVQAEEAALQQQLAVQQFAANYPIQLQWPAVVTGHRRTDPDILQHRLLEAGLLYDVPITTADAVEAAGRFVANLEATDCFHAVSVQIGDAPVDSQQGQQHQNDNAAPQKNGDESNTLPERPVHIAVREKNWYRLHAGAGLKTDMLGSNQHTQIATDSFLPTAEFEMSAGLRNLGGVLDRTDLQYSVDTQNIGAWTFTHTRPLYTALPDALSETVLSSAHGSQYNLALRAALDTVDHELISSYKEYQRLLSVKASTSTTPNTSAVDPWNCSLEWAVNYRDMIPKRHPTIPYHLAASPEIVAAAGASVKHSITAKVKYDNTSTADGDLSRIPVRGIQLECMTELATPPGDVGFIKAQTSLAGHFPTFLPKVFLHGTISTGFLSALHFQGLCRPSGPSDRFLLGGTGSFRGFVPAGIGPRSSASKMGDALGGDVFYTASLSASTVPPSALTQSPLEAIALVASHIRLFGFATAGTCAAWNNNNNTPLDLLRSTRLSAGIGLATQALGPRLEATYAWPLRYGPRDGRRRFQFGVSFSL